MQSGSQLCPQIMCLNILQRKFNSEALYDLNIVLAKQVKVEADTFKTAEGFRTCQSVSICRLPLKKSLPWRDDEDATPLEMWWTCYKMLPNPLQRWKHEQHFIYFILFYLQKTQRPVLKSLTVDKRVHLYPPFIICDTKISGQKYLQQALVFSFQDNKKAKRWGTH